jgi:hypothetical protein
MSLARAVEYIHEMGEVHGNIVPVRLTFFSVKVY